MPDDQQDTTTPAAASRPRRKPATEEPAATPLLEESHGSAEAAGIVTPPEAGEPSAAERELETLTEDADRSLRAPGRPPLADLAEARHTRRMALRAKHAPTPPAPADEVTA